MAKLLRHWTMLPAQLCVPTHPVSRSTYNLLKCSNTASNNTGHTHTECPCVVILCFLFGKNNIRSLWSKQLAWFICFGVKVYLQAERQEYKACAEDPALNNLALQVLEPLRLACAQDAPRLALPALACLHKLARALPDRHTKLLPLFALLTRCWHQSYRVSARGPALRTANRSCLPLGLLELGVAV